MPEPCSRDAHQGGGSIQRQIFKHFSVMKIIYTYLYIVYDTSLWLFTYKEPNTKRDHTPDKGKYKVEAKANPHILPQSLLLLTSPHVPHLPSVSHLLSPTHFPPPRHVPYFPAPPMSSSSCPLPPPTSSLCSPPPTSSSHLLPVYTEIFLWLFHCFLLFQAPTLLSVVWSW